MQGKNIYDFNQFITWKPILKEGSAKPAKIPYNHLTGSLNEGYHSGEGWMSYDEACAAATTHGLGVGFVFTRNDPFFFVDLDNCATPDGQWNQFALSVLNMFPGAMMEISVSGKGLHIIGQGSAPEGHRTRDQARGMEIYTHSRFVALGSSVVGDSSTNHGPALAALLSTMPEPTVKGSNIPWTTEPVAEWDGPEDDDELIRRMLNARTSVAAAMGTKASIKDLWEVNVEKLQLAFPSDQPGKPFDHSSADAALIAHLAWWTGKNSERMLRLFKRSGLFREDKWKREDYKLNTIGGGIATTTSVYKQVKKTEITEDGQEVPELGTMWADQQQEYFKGCAYVRSQHKVFVPDIGELLKPDTFNAAFGGYLFQLDQHNKTTKSAFECLTQSRIHRFPKVHKTCFRPELAPGSIINHEGISMVNRYIPAKVASVPGDVTPFMDLMSKLYPDPRDHEIIMSYIAAVVQYPGIKFQWSPLVQGVQGNGKSFITRCLSAAVGERFTHLPNSHELGEGGGKFNDWLAGKLFIGIEEIYVSDKREVNDILKVMITNERMEFQAKGGDQETGDNRANFYCTTNHKEAIIKTKDDRRWCVFYTPQQTLEDLINWGMDGNYFTDLYHWARSGGYAHVTNYLQNYQISEQFNPATNCHRAPDTSSTAEAIVASLGALEQEIMDAIDSGVNGFKGNFISSVRLHTYIRDELRRKIGNKARGQVVERLGYVKHPALADGRTSKPIFAEGNVRPILYVKKDSIAYNVNNPEQVLQMYIKEQGYNGELTTQQITATY